MPERATIKNKAKSAFRGNYWLYVALFAIISVVTGLSFGFSSDLSSITDTITDSINGVITGGASLFSFGIALVVSLIIAGLSIAFSVFLANVVSVSGARIGLEAYRSGKPTFGDLLYGFKPVRYWRCVGAMALYTLLTTLATMCFIVPGIIVGLGLSQIPYILAEDDEISASEAMSKSWDMMGGHKWELFVFQLTFIGWLALSAISCGVVGIFYSVPYMKIALAGYHAELVDSAKARRRESGIPEIDELIGAC